MPGIFGIVDTDRPARDGASERTRLVARMAAAMCYEADYIVRVMERPDLGACAGYVGRDHSAVGVSAPESAADRGIAPRLDAIVTAGEPAVENGLDHVCECAGSGGSRLASHITTRDVEGLRDVEGPFAGFLMDPQRGRCLLFTDRYGSERVFLHVAGSRIYFASEAKAILAVVPSTRAHDAGGVAEWLACGCTIGTRSLYRGVEILDAGTAVVLKPGCAPSKAPYFDRTQLENLPPLTADRFVEQFSASLGSAVSRAVGDSQMSAVSLTGGLDSRVVLAFIDASAAAVPCYTFGSMYRTTMDVRVAREVAACCDQPHYVLELDRDFIQGIDAHFRHAVSVSDGYLGLPGSSELYLNRKAAAIRTIRVTGNWGGELMRGVRAFKFRLPGGSFIRPGLMDGLQAVADTFESTRNWHPLSYTLFQQMPHQAFGRYAIERSQLTVRSPFLANAVVETLYRAPADVRGSMATVTELLRRRPGFASIPTDLGRLGRSSDAVSSIRQRYRRAVIKAEYLTSHGAPNWIAAVSARVPLLERGFLGRDKFQHFRVWMRKELQGFVRDAVSRRNLSSVEEWFDPRAVSRMADDHIAGRANYTDELDKVMTLAESARGFSTLAAAPVTAGAAALAGRPALAHA